ncbi:Uncharacterised protein [Bordetella pertussis]|nr:Uncharacterised protein [Bordetella pertussis]CPO03045.1 Uncharacterised protein [Bordetella pertussis]
MATLASLPSASCSTSDSSCGVILLASMVLPPTEILALAITLTV